MMEYVSFSSLEAFKLYLEAGGKRYPEVGAKLKYDEEFKVTLYPTKNGSWVGVGAWATISLDLADLEPLIEKVLPENGVTLHQDDFKESDCGGISFWFTSIGTPDDVITKVEDTHLIPGDNVGIILDRFFIGYSKRLRD